MKTLRYMMGALLLGACTAATANGDYVLNYQEIVKAADWSKMETVVVELDEYGYVHEGLVFKAGQPYKLRMRNIGEKKHYFTAPGFFKAIATRKVQSDKDGEIKAPYFTALEMMAEGGTLDLYFVAVRPGTYPVHCTVDDHEKRGMHDSITIVP